jgi:hypothetical protein
MPRDAIWVMPNGVTKVVTLDDDGNLIEDVPEVVETPAEPQPPPPDPDPPKQHRQRGRRSRR